VLALVSGYAAQFGAAQLGDAWLVVAQKARDYGVWAVLLASIFPTPPRLLTAATLLAGVGTLSVVAAVFAGKLVWFSAFLLLLTRAPRVMARLPILGTAVSRFEHFRQTVLEAHATGR
jgi:membrane protein YqaA with SNARE-associated domain